VLALLEHLLSPGRILVWEPPENSGCFNEPQLTRGGDTAWRRDIDRDLHLHYWELEAGGVELASVVDHNNFYIPP
jgi:hypothetical protein